MMGESADVKGYENNDDVNHSFRVELIKQLETS